MNHFLMGMHPIFKLFGDKPVPLIVAILGIVATSLAVFEGAIWFSIIPGLVTLAGGYMWVDAHFYGHRSRPWLAAPKKLVMVVGGKPIHISTSHKSLWLGFSILALIVLGVIF